MHKTLRIFILSILVFLIPAAAKAQGGTDYRFLEVMDYANKPVANASVNVKASCGGGEHFTDEKGQLERFAIGGGDCGTTSDFTISKAGYYPFRDVALFRFYYLNRLFQEQFNDRRNDFLRPFKVELLPIAQNKAERKAIGNEQLKREVFWAIADKDVAAIEKLLKSGISPNITTDELRGFPGPKGVSAVIFAASFGGIETVKSFLKAKVDLRKESSPARDILLYYLSNHPLSSRNYVAQTEEEKKNLAEFQDGVDVLIDAGANLKATTKNGKTALMIAVENGDVRTVRTLLDKNLPVNQQDSAGKTALIYARHFNYSFEIIEMLLKAGANINLFAHAGDNCTSPLINAAAAGNFALVKLLLDNKAAVNLKCDDGKNALRTAIKFESYSSSATDRDKVIQTLIDAGAEVNFADDSGQTNLMLAVGTSNPYTVELLLKNGAQINARDKKGETALMKTYFKTLKVLLDSGGDPNIVAQDSYGEDCQTALMHTATNAEAEQSIRMLAQRGANIDVSCRNGETALTKAVRSARVENVKTLLELGADAKSEQGSRALQQAKYMLREYSWSKNDSEQIIKLLEAAGAK